MIYQENIAKIDASEKLSLITALALGNGNLQKNDSTRLIGQLERTAMGGTPKKKQSRPTPQQLAGMGIGVVVKNKKVKENG